MKLMKRHPLVQQTAAMQKMENIEWFRGMEELTSEEARTIVGGESLGFWIGYTIGSLFASSK
jgi:hypothetical protein